jgi:putative transposase
VGHLFQGRYKAIVVDRDAYLLALLRYVVLNPVRAGLAKGPGDWPWSSYNATVEARKAPKWLTADAVLAQFGLRRGVARRRYGDFVEAAPSDDNLWQALRGQIYLGEEAFVERMQGRLGSAADDVNVPRAQRRSAAPPLSEMASRYASRNDAMVAAYETGDYTQKAIGDFFGVHFSTVGRIVRRARKGKAA